MKLSYESNTGRHARKRRRKRIPIRIAILLVALIFLSSLAIGGTLAYVLTNSSSLTNSFVTADMSCEIVEDFSNGTEKRNVCVKNTGDAPAYIRVKLLPYWYDKQEENIVAMSAWAPLFTAGNGWVQGQDGYYYYVSPVKPGECTAVLISSISLKQDEVTLARQVLEIIASCVQAEPDEAVLEAWSGTNGSVSKILNGSLVIKEGE